MKNAIAVLAFLFLLVSNCFPQATVMPVVDFGVSAISTSGDACTAVGKIQSFHDNSYFDTLVFWRSDDAGMTWKRQNTRIGMRPSESYDSPNYIDQVDRDATYLVGWNGIDDGLIVSTLNGGGMWSAEPSSVQSKLLQVSCVGSGEGMILGEAPPRILLRGDVGWYPVDFSPQEGSPQAWALGNTYGNGRYTVYCTSGGFTRAGSVDAVYRTQDGWKSFDSTIVPFSFSDSLKQYDADCIFGRGEVVVASAYTFSNIGAGRVSLCRSTDGGRNWTVRELSGTTSPSPIRFITRDESDTILAHDAASRNLIDFSFDGGLTWHVDTVVLASDGSGPVCVNTAARLPDGSFVAGYSTTVAPYLFLGSLQLPGNAGVHSQESSSQQPRLVYLANDRLRVEGIGPIAQVLDVLGRPVEVQWQGDEISVKRLTSGLYLLVDGMGRMARFIR